MKKIKYFLFIAGGLLAASCSSDDDNNNAASGDYLPLKSGNYWVYNVPGSIDSGTDSLYVANDTVINNTTYKKLKTKDLPYGFYSGAITAGGVRQSGSKLMISGDASLAVIQDLPLDISLADFVVFDSGASADSQLGTVSGTLQTTYEQLPITIDYTLTTTAKEDLATYTAGGHTYTNVKRVETTLEAAVSISVSGFSFPLLAKQKVITSSQYYANNIGVVHVTTDFTYTLNDLPLESLPIPQTGAETQEEILTTYQVTP